MKIVRRPSRIIVAKKAEASLTTPTPPANLDVTIGSALGPSTMLSSSLNISSAHGPHVLLKVRVNDVEDKAIHYSTTISV